MQHRFSKRMDNVPRSFIREILKVAADPAVISFAGGLPNPELFPVEAVSRATQAVLATAGPDSLQYSTTEGMPALREFIASRYRDKKGLDVSPEDIVITTGSQQCLDLIGKIFLDPGDRVVFERPGYLGAIQAFAMYEPEMVSVGLEADGPDLDELAAVLPGSKLFYAVPNFQNPSGLSYSEAKRAAVAGMLAGGPVFVEDDPYGELRFRGEPQRPMFGREGLTGILLGSFSKVAAPGLRLGWVAAPHEIREQIVTAKQAADLHTSSFTQAVLMRYLEDNDIDAHIALIRERYGRQCESMLEAALRHFPEEAVLTEPEGGMFLWCTLPPAISVMELFECAVEQKVAFVPGHPFHVDGGGNNTMRLNFSNVDEATIDEGMRRLGRAMKRFLRRVC